ncbi:MAG: gluconate:H+ symporter [Cytophagaceae bacterium]|nr:gluconate:H+ symporter [Cytophagaceae bacterium]
MTLLIVAAGVALLLLLIIVFKLNAFLSLILTSLFVGIAQGMALETVLKSVQSGVGSTLGSIAFILAFGVILGKILTETGAARRITTGLVQAFGVKQVKLAMVLTGFAVGIAMFYNAGFVVLVPIVFTTALETGLPLIYLALAMASSLSITHGYLPPHPGPTAIAALFKANMGRTLIYGIIVAIPAMLVTGLIFPEFHRKRIANPPKGLLESRDFTEAEMPGFGISLLVALVPVLLMAAATVGELLIDKTSSALPLLRFFGDATVAMLIAVLFAIWALGLRRGQSMKQMMKWSDESVGAVAGILLIIAGGGAFKQILIDSGVGNVIAEAFEGSALSPLFLGWLIASAIRVTLGSATVAGLMAGGIMQPILAVDPSINIELMVISIGAGSLMFSHVNDAGFWLFKEYFGLSIKDTIMTWSIMETIVAVVGLMCVLALNLVV